MAIQVSVPVQNARLDAFETTAGVSAILKIRVGTQPANCAASDTGTVLALLSLPADYMAAASSGTKAKSGTWEVLSAAASGTPGHFRIYASDGTTCHMQGSVIFTGSGGDMTLDTTTVTAGQKVTITTFTLTDANG
jgi:uncharacterized cupin superfamily protein